MLLNPSEMVRYPSSVRVQEATPMCPTSRLSARTIGATSAGRVHLLLVSLEAVAGVFEIENRPVLVGHMLSLPLLLPGHEVPHDHNVQRGEKECRAGLAGGFNGWFVRPCAVYSAAFSSPPEGTARRRVRCSPPDWMGEQERDGKHQGVSTVEARKILVDVARR